jgi:hypothetical protein
MTFFGESLGVYDIYVVAGSLNPSDLYDGVYRVDDGVSVTVTAGDSFIVGCYGPNYLLNTDAVGGLKWVLRASGTGTIDLADAHDPNWAGSAPFSAIASIAVSGGLTDYEVDASTSLRDAPLLTGDTGGGEEIQVRITVVSGSVTLDKVRLQIEPIGGIVGHWSDPHDAGTFTWTGKVRTMTTTSTALEEASREGEFPDIPQGPMSAAAAGSNLTCIIKTGDLGGPYDLALPLNPAYSVLETYSTPLFFGDTYTVRVTATMAQCVATFLADAGYETHRTGPWTDPALAEGIDYIRDPRKTGADDNNYIANDPGDAAISGWNNQNVHIAGYAGGGDQIDGIMWLRDAGNLVSSRVPWQLDLALDDYIVFQRIVETSPGVFEFVLAVDSEAPVLGFDWAFPASNIGIVDSSLGDTSVDVPFYSNSLTSLPTDRFSIRGFINLQIGACPLPGTVPPGVPPGGSSLLGSVGDHGGDIRAYLGISKTTAPVVQYPPYRYWSTGPPPGPNLTGELLDDRVRFWGN